MKRLHLSLALIVFLLLLVGCTATDRSGSNDGTPQPGTRQPERFPLSSDCIDCHDNIVSADGSHYSFVFDWSSSSHALSATDPFFLALARSESQSLPGADEAVQEACAGCHLPMADLSASADEQPRSFLDNSAIAGHDYHDLYREGDSCMLCHQLTEHAVAGNTAFLGSRLSIDLNSGTAGSPRLLYGYHTIGADSQQLKLNSMGYINAQSDAERKSIICTVCHTLYTDSYTTDGQPTGSQLPEQVIFSEWLHSGLADRSCQSCHMPVITPAGPVANTTTAESLNVRISSHSFVGANALLFDLADAAEDTVPRPDNNTSPVDNHERFSHSRAVTEQFLRAQTATLNMEGAIVGGAFDPQLELDVRIDSLVGHKFPTGFPARRAWLHVTVYDQNDAVVFESGAWLDDGLIVGNDMDLVSGSFEPHYDVIGSSDQVQIYESVMIDSDGNVTTNLLQGIYYGKDNRLLPPGFDKSVTATDIAVVGGAFDDPDFVGGGDITHYRIALPGGTTQARVTVELLYHPINYRFIENLRAGDSGEQAMFLELLNRVQLQPSLVDQIEDVFER